MNGPDEDDAIVEASMELIRMFGRRDRLADTPEAVEDADPQVIWLALSRPLQTVGPAARRPVQAASRRGRVRSGPRCPG